MAETQYITIPNGENGVQVAGAAGANLWREIQGNDALEQMAKVLPDTAVGQKLTRDKLTVPTPWSSVVTFDILLDSQIDYGHIQENTRNEWKTLITLIALHKIRNIPITFEQIDSASNNFYKNIQMQYPKNGIFKDGFDGVNIIQKEKESWKNITLIKLDGEVIGMLTPSNIVCSRYAYNEDTTPKAVQWFKKNGLMNDNYDMLSPVQYILKADGVPNQVSLNYITSWLEKIKTFLKATDANEDVFNVPTTLIGRIDGFIKEIKDFAESQGIIAQNIVLKNSVEPNEFMNIREMIESIQGEHSWKGILTAIAYAGLSNYSITYVADSNDTKMVCKGLFHQSIIDDPSARAVLLDGKCIGVIRNSYILSVPTKALPEDTVAKLKKCQLMNDGAEYNDPVEFILENPKRFAYIISWLNYVQLKLAGVQPATDPLVNNEIAGFINKLNTSLSTKDQNFRVEADKLRNTLVQFTNAGANTVFELFSTLTSSCDFVKTDIEKTTMIAGANSMVLFSEDTITGDLLNYYNKSKVPGASEKVVMTEGISVFNSDNVFENKIYYISDIDDAEKNKRINNAGNKNLWTIKKNVNNGIGKVYTVLWPLKQSIFESISNDAIYDNITYVYDEKTDKCTIKLPLAVVGSGDAGKVITKTFDGPDNPNSINSGVIESELLPGISIWPYAVSSPEDTNKWKTYFTYETKTQKYETGMPNPYIVECMPQEANLDENELELPSDTTEYCRKIKCRESIPEYLMIKDTVGNSYGMILLEKPVVMSHQNGEVDIGLDFGTSSTTVYSSAGGIKEPVRFDEDMAIEPICHLYDDASSYFIPKEYSSNNYYPSLLRISSNKIPKVYEGIKLPFMTKNIIFQYKYFRNGADGDGNDKTVLKSNIKWDPIEPDNTQMYLSQIVMQTILAARKKGKSTINWHASYPSAFSKTQTSDYKKNLEKIINDMHALVNNSVAIGEEVAFETESIAAAKYIVNNAANQGCSLVTIVDIGGGSTDISSWEVGAGIPLPLFQTSIEIASRVIFLEPLKKLIEGDNVLKKYISGLGHPFSNIDKYIEAMNKGDDVAEENFNVLVEQLLSLYSNTLMGMIDNLMNQAEVIRFRRKVVTGFYAILFYAIKSFNATTSDKVANMVIQLSGNGAKMFEWISPADIEKIETLLRKLINAKDGNNIGIKIAFNSNTAKTEAARGMLENINATEAPKPVVICGTDIDLKYRDANGDIRTETIDKNSNMWDNEIVKQCYADTAGITPMQFNATEDRELCKEFLKQVQEEIYGGTIAIQVPEATMASKVTADMGQSLGSKRLTSPFFSQIKAIISEM